MQFDDLITAQQFHRFPGTSIVTCCLTLENGYCVTGSSTSCDPDVFDETQARAEAQEEAQIQAFRMERYWMAGLRALSSEAAAEAAVAKLG